MDVGFLLLYVKCYKAFERLQNYHLCLSHNTRIYLFTYFASFYSRRTDFAAIFIEVVDNISCLFLSLSFVCPRGLTSSILTAAHRRRVRGDSPLHHDRKNKDSGNEECKQFHHPRDAVISTPGSRCACLEKRIINQKAPSLV